MYLKQYLYITIIAISIVVSKPTNAVTIDNILGTFFYSHNDSSYLILHESIFHPTSGSYKQGKLYTQSYNSSQISVYNMADGKLIVQKDMGVIDSTEACIILGCSPNKLWVYSKKHKSGLQSFNPLTLKINTSEAQIYQLINTSIGRFDNPKWQNLNNSYGFDAIQQKLIITNIKNEQYYIDATSYATQKITDKINLSYYPDNYLTESAIYKGSMWELNGYEHMRLQCGSYSLNDPSFLYGKFIIERNQHRLFKHFSSTHEDLMCKDKYEINMLENDSLIEVVKNNIAALILKNQSDDILLQTDINSIYIYSKNSTRPDAIVNITKLTSKQFGEFTIDWSTSISGMYYNVAQARNTIEFKQNFKNDISGFNYQLIQIFNNKLIIIYLTQVCCINTQSGDIIWRFNY